MLIWKATYTPHDGQRPSQPAIVLAETVNDALIRLRERLASHTAESSNQHIKVMPAPNPSFATLVNEDWPVSLLTGALDLPARALPTTLPDADCLTVTRFDKEELQVELDRMLNHTPSCFALIDGANFSGLSELLDTTSLEYECLFRGGARTNGGPVAPWIVRLQPDSSFSRRLIRTSLGQSGGFPSPPAMLLETDHPLETVARHFRRLTRVRSASDGRWLYFRFCDPHTMDDLRASITPNDAAAVLGPYSPLVLHPAGAFRLTRSGANSETMSNRTTFELASRHLTAMRHRQRIYFAQKVMHDVTKIIPNMTPLAISELVSRGMDLCQDTGLFQQDSTAGYILLSALLGQHFTQVYGQYAQILDHNRSEAERKTMIHATLERLQKRRFSDVS